MTRNTQSKIVLAAAASLLVSPAVAAAAPAPATKAPLDTVFVAGTAEPWVDTGVWVVAGQALDIRASGAVNTWRTNVPFVPFSLSGPSGQKDAPCTNAAPAEPATDCALNGANYGALVARIGSDTFDVGSAEIITAVESGWLQLAVNDNLTYYGDNAGGFAVQVAAG